MRHIEGTLSEALKSFVGDDSVDRSAAFSVSTYRQLMEQVAQLAFLNKDHMLFFRGQKRDYKNRADASTFYPSIYRGDPLRTPEIHYRFGVLEQAANLLSDAVEQERITGFKEIRRKKYVQWSILQHYEVCDTPLLDFTHSLAVACSFAQNNNSEEWAYVYVFGLPYITNRISINSEHDLVNVRLLSICPPDALRPYYQEGYVAGTEDITSQYDSKTELDFKNRLIAKFQIPTSKRFWGRGFSSIPDAVLYPRQDKFKRLCDKLRIGIEQDLQPLEIGGFLKLWILLEEQLESLVSLISDRKPSPARAISLLQKHDRIPSEYAIRLNSIRKFRNQLVHSPQLIEAGRIKEYTEELRLVIADFPPQR